MAEKVKSIKFGSYVIEPEEGQEAIIVHNGETIRTSPVQKFLSFYEDRVWIIETDNSIYVISKE